MASTLQLVETTALATVNYDFNTSTGVGNPNLVRTSFGVGGAFALGAPAFQSREFEPPHRDGGLSVFTRNGITVISWRNRFYTSPVSYDDLSASFGTLSQLFNRGGTLKWIADGSANTRYRDFLPSPAPALLDGKPIELLQTILQGDTPEGITLALRCQPFWYEAELDSDSNKLRNATFLFTNGNARPLEWALDNAANISAEAVSTANEWFELTIATTGTRNFQQSTDSAVAASGDVWTFSYYAHVASGSNCRVRAVIRYLDAAGGVLGSESPSAQTTLTTTEQRISVTSSAAPASTSRVRVFVRFENSTAGAVTPRLRKAQLEEAAAVTTFRVGTETIFADPAGTKVAAASSIAAVATGVVTVGTHSVRVTFANIDGLEIAQGTKSNVVSIAADQKYNVTAIPLGPPGTTKRRLYMTIAGDTGNHLFAVDVGDNTSTTATINLADGSLGAAAPTTSAYASNGRVFPFISVGQAPTEVSLEIEGDGSAIYQAVIAGKSSEGTVGRFSLLDYMNSRRFAQMEDASPLGTGVTVGTTGTGFSGTGQLLLPTLTEEFRLTGRITFTTLLESLRGRWDVWLRFGAGTGTMADPKCQLRWGASTTTPAPFANNTVIPEGVGANVYGDLYLGQIIIPDEGTLTGVVLEPWVDTNAFGNMRADAIMLVPADVQSSIVGAFGGGAQQSWVKAQFVTPVTSPGGGTAVTDGNRLDTSADNLGTQPNAGLAFAVGSHTVKFDATIHHASSSASHDTQARYVVRNVTDSVDTVSVLGLLVTGKAPQDRQETVTETYTAVSGKLYQYQVRVGTLGNASDYITVNSFKDTFLPVLSGTEKFRTDPERTEVSTVSADGSLISPLGVQGPVPLRLGPGLAAIYVSVADLPSAGFDVPLTTLGRWAKVRTRHKPRYF